MSIEDFTDIDLWSNQRYFVENVDKEKEKYRSVYIIIIIVIKSRG